MNLLTLALSLKRMKRIELHGKKFKRFIDAKSIQNAIDDLAIQINRDYNGKRPVFIGVLNGSFLFTADVVRRFKSDCEVAFLRLASYDGTDSTGKVNELVGLKEDLKDFDGLGLVSNIKVYDFKWKAADERAYGVMAHELKEVIPQAVDGEKDAERMQSADYSKIVPILVKAIQELKADNDSLRERIQTLENQ